MSGSADELNTERTVRRWLPEIPVLPVAERYEVAGEAIGRGGFGVVYRARKLQLPQWVAVKRLFSAGGAPPSLAEQRRFVREVTLAASLDHPHVVRIEDWGRDAEGLYVVMALIQGGSLKQHVEHHGPVPLGQLLRYARQICLGLQAAHQQGIIHRDLKPANVLLDGSGNVWEWCADWYDETYYGSTPPQDPQGPASGSLRVLRGGSWLYGPIFLRSSYRRNYTPDYRDGSIGCRVLYECG